MSIQKSTFYVLSHGLLRVNCRSRKEASQYLMEESARVSH